jgi:O-acetyl-ADP-ribose deacetylase (regulator of RNase III)
LNNGRDDDWQLELLCNIAAGEFLMPIGTAMELEREPINIETILRLQRQYDVSTEAISLRLVNLTSEPCTIFVAARTSEGKGDSFRIDYSIASRTSTLNIPSGLEISGKTVLSDCIAIGYTAKQIEHWPSLPKMNIECIGIPPYPRSRWPRIVGIACIQTHKPLNILRIKYVYGDALEARGTGSRIIAHIVNDKTPNWGAGFPRVLKSKWPSVQEDFRTWALSSSKNLSLGEVHLTPVSDDLNIVHMIAQHGYGPSRKPRIRYVALKTCLEKLAEIALNQSASIHMPRIGTGQAGGYWSVIAELIDMTLIKQNIEVTIYDLPSSLSMDNIQGVPNLFSTLK